MKVAEIQVADRTAKYEKVEMDKRVSTPHVEEKVDTTKNVEIKEKNIEEALEKINKHLENANTKIKFKIHDSAHSLNNKISIKVIDEESEKVIAEIPSEEAIELSERMETIIGFLFDASN